MTLGFTPETIEAWPLTGGAAGLDGKARTFEDLRCAGAGA